MPGCSKPHRESPPFPLDADGPWTGRGTAAAAAWIFRGGRATPRARRRRYAFGAVDEVTRALLARALAAALGTPVSVGALELSLVAGRLECSRVSLSQYPGFPGGEAASLGGATVEFDLSEVFRRRAVVCAAARLRDVRARVARWAVITLRVNFKLRRMAFLVEVLANFGPGTDRAIGCAARRSRGTRRAS